MSVRSASRGSPAAKSIRLALRTSSIVETRSASFVRWVLRCFGRRCLSSEPTLSAIFLMPFIMCFQGPPGVEPLNHTPLPHVNSLASKLMDGKAGTYWNRVIFFARSLLPTLNYNSQLTLKKLERKIEGDPSPPRKSSPSNPPPVFLPRLSDLQEKLGFNSPFPKT